MHSNMKRCLIGAAKVCVFLVLVAMVLNWAQGVLISKETNMDAVYYLEKMPKDSVDVLLVGSSHMEVGIQPAQLFGKYGIAAANVATTAQSIPNSYYMLKEFMDKQHPKVVVLDLFTLFFPELAFMKERNHPVLDYMPMSRNKLEAIQALCSEGKTDFLFPLTFYHTRWKELKEKDYDMGMVYATYSINNGVAEYKDPFVPLDESDTAPIHDIPQYYLEKIFALCRQTNTKLLLTVLPYRADVDNNDVSWKYQQQVYNSAAILAAENGVDYLNTLHYLEEMNFDFTKDMIEWSHMNFVGAEKATDFLGQYLINHYDLPDRSKDADYAMWASDYEFYLNELTYQKKEYLALCEQP